MSVSSQNNRIYLDYQATTPIDNTVLEAMLPFYKDFYGNPHSHHHIMGWEADKAITTSKNNVAKLINADPNEIIYTSGATEANNLAIIGVARKMQKQRNTILVSAIEHKCILAASQNLKNNGFKIKIIPVDYNGLVDLEAFSKLLNEDVFLVSVMMTNNEIGSIQPIKEITELTHKIDALMHTDAAQAPTSIKIDVLELNVDLMSLSAHKMYGPKGIGALYIRKGIEKYIEPIIWGGGQQDGIRSGTLPTPLCVGFGKASEIIINERDKIFKITKQLRDLFFRQCQTLNIKTKLIGPPLRDRHFANLSVLFEGYDAENLISIMQPNLSVSTGSACTSGAPEASHVLKAIGLEYPHNKNVIRFSFGKYLTEKDITESFKYLKKAIIKSKKE